MNLKSFVAGLVVGLLAVLWAWLATFRGRVESRAEAKGRAHRRGREWERERSRVVIHPAARPAAGSTGPRGGRQPPPAGAAFDLAQSIRAQTQATRDRRRLRDSTEREG